MFTRWLWDSFISNYVVTSHAYKCNISPLHVLRRPLSSLGNEILSYNISASAVYGLLHLGKPAEPQCRDKHFTVSAKEKLPEDIRPNSGEIHFCTEDFLPTIVCNTICLQQSLFYIVRARPLNLGFFFQPYKFRQSHIFSAVCPCIWFKFGEPFAAPKIKRGAKFQSNVSTDSWENVHVTELLRLKNKNLNLKDELCTLLNI